MNSAKFQYNFVGRILGPRGMTAKQLEQETGCKIMVRGKGSMRDKAKVCCNSIKYERLYAIRSLITFSMLFIALFSMLRLDDAVVKRTNFTGNFHKIFFSYCFAD